MKPSQATSLRMARSLLLLPLVLASAPFSAPSQVAAPPPPLRFEVVSIRPHQNTGNDPSNRQMLPGGRFVATGTSVRTLIRIAFLTDDNRISGAPPWTGDQTFDIDATTEGRADVKTPQQFQQVLQSLLQDRFGLKFHREQKEASIYLLELDKPGKPGASLKPSGPDSQPNMSTNSNNLKTVMKASKMSMAEIAAVLQRQAGRPVEDHTGLQGNFDFQIEWASVETPDSADASLFTVLKEQLGLKLRPAKGTAEMIVIDQITLPSAN